MSIFVWNTRGLGSQRAFNTLRMYKEENNLALMFLLETKCQHVNLEHWRVKLGFQGKLVVNNVGVAGGLCFFFFGLRMLMWSCCLIPMRTLLL